MHTNFSVAKLEKKSAQIMRVNTVFLLSVCATCPPAHLVLVFTVRTVHNVLLLYFIRALSGWLFLLLAAYCAWRLESRDVGDKDSFHSRCVVVVQLIILPAAVWNLVSTAHSIKDRKGLPLINQIISWSMLGEYAECWLVCDLILEQNGPWFYK
jgi:hypothetical protein